MGAAVPASPTPEALYRATQQGSPHLHQWHALASSHGSTVARLARTLRLLEDRCQQILPLASSRHLAADSGLVAARGGCRREVGLESALCGRNHYSRASARGRW